MLLVNGTTIGVTICEDMWSPEGPTPVYAAAGAEVIVTIDASPFHIGNSGSREQMLATSARENGVIVAYANMVGGQDELVFDGNSVILDQSGTVVARGHVFREELLVADVNVEAVSRGRMTQGRKTAWTRKAVSAVDRLVVKSAAIQKKKRTRIVPEIAEPLEEIEAVYQALVLAVKDYVQQEWIYPSGDWGEWRRRFSSDRGHCGGCAWRRTCARRLHAVSVHLTGERRGCRGTGTVSPHRRADHPDCADI